MTAYGLGEKKRRTKLWIALVVLTLGALILSMLLTGPSPPKKIIMATGQPGGGYANFGEKYKEQLKKNGLEVELVNTKGSIDNMERLLEHKADVAFAQGGTYQFVHDEDPRVLRGIAAIYLEPLWVFYRGPKVVQMVSEFKGKRISIGLTESGTEAVARELLKAHGIDETNSTLENPANPVALRRLKDGDLDVAFFVSSYEDKVILELLNRKDILLMNFQRHDIAHTRQFAYLKPVTLAEGLIDLKENLPRQTETLLAPAALLVCRDNLHPQVVEQILKAAQKIHGGGNRIDAKNQFPSLEGMDPELERDTTAETYMKSGESFLSRHLPYWALRLLLQARILILPLLAIWLPFLKIIPMIYNYRVNSLLKKHYAGLRDVESGIALADTPQDLRERLKVLENLRTDMEALSRKVPAQFQRDVYHWRLHVSLVHSEALSRLQRMEGQGEPGQAELPPALAGRKS